jgi:SAM-dependent methyltransferase
VQLKLLEILGCPYCYNELTCHTTESEGDGGVRSGVLQCARCHQRYPIIRGIPRFTGSDNYASSFGYQWNRFRLEQLDSANGTRLSHERFYSETGWTTAWMAGKWILDAGCGAGRFLDVVTETEADVVGLDISDAVEAARDNLAGHDRVHFVQASIYQLPFRDAVFDGVYCIGVIQHTPDPLQAVRSLPRVLKTGGRIAYTIYEKRRYTRLHSKYLVRPLTRRLSPRFLLAAIRTAMPILFPLSEVAFRIPIARRLLRAAIPIANYVDQRALTLRQRYRWAVMDTFDMLAPEYDQPQTEAAVSDAMRGADLGDIMRMLAGGVTLTGRKLPASGASLTPRHDPF